MVEPYWMVMTAGTQSAQSPLFGSRVEAEEYARERVRIGKPQVVLKAELLVQVIEDPKPPIEVFEIAEAPESATPAEVIGKNEEEPG